jgi:hypothetical protein
MADTTPTPATEPAKKPKFTRGIANRQFLNEIADSRAVATAARDTDYAAALAEVEFDATLPGRIDTLADSVEAQINDIIGARGTTTMSVREKDSARARLLETIAPIQTAAKRTFKGGAESLRTAYGITLPMATMDFDEFLTICHGILDRLSPDTSVTPPAPPQDKLPGITAARIAALADALEQCGGKKQNRAENQTDAEKLLEKLEADVAALAALRHEAQLAADQAFPWRTPGVAAIRKAFLLQEDRPLAD